MTKRETGFTLTELLVVIFIIILMTSIVLANYRRGEESLALERATHKLAQDLRRTAEMAVGGKENPLTGEFPAGGWGLYFSGPDSSYILFADNNGNFQYDAGDTSIETLFLGERGVRIQALSPGPPLSIIFFPPDPTVTINPGPVNEATITLIQRGETREIKINRVGLIDIE